MTQKAEFFAHETAVIDDPVKIGKGTKIWHFSHIMPNAEIGEGCNLGQNVFVGSNVKLGNNCKVQNNVSIYTGVICEDDVFLGPSMVFTNVVNPRSGVIRKSEYKQTYLEYGVSVGANATIVCGARLGKFAFVGAGAVITKDVPSYALMAGVPARQIGWMSEYGERLEFNPAGEAICPGSNEKYILENNEVRKVV
ncbi:MAG: acyltransferase [Bacteroidota bacterium]